MTRCVRVAHNILTTITPIITFYDQMAKLDNEYLMKLQNLRSDVGILGIELREFCLGLEQPLKKVDPTFSIDRNNSTREISIEFADRIESLQADSGLIKSHFTTVSNMAFEMKIRSRELFNHYREIQELKILTNNKVVSDFNKVIKENSITATPDVIIKKLSDKNKELIDKMKSSHKIDKIEFEKHLNKIYELN